jgi:hypothetical protein
MMQDIQPTMIDEVPRIIVIGDVHGDVRRFMQCLYHANVISKDMTWIAQPPNTVVVQLGDQVDSLMRNPNAAEWEEVPDVEMLTLTDKLDEIARVGGGRVLSIIGNHEFMNIMSEFSYVSQKSRSLYDIKTREANFQKKSGMFAKILAKRNLVLKIGSFLFCHGGLLPQHLDVAKDNLFMINDSFRRFITDRYMSMDARDIFSNVVNEDGIIWTRYYVEDHPDLESTIDNVLQRTNSTAMFIGHCTVPQTTVLRNKIVLADAALSRSFGADQYQYIELLGITMKIHELR